MDSGSPKKASNLTSIIILLTFLGALLTLVNECAKLLGSAPAMTSAALTQNEVDELNRAIDSAAKQVEAIPDISSPPKGGG